MLTELLNMLRELFGGVLSKVVSTWRLHRLRLGVARWRHLLILNWLSVLTEPNVKTWPRNLSDGSIRFIRYLRPVTLLHRWRLIIAVYSMSSNDATSWLLSSLHRLPRILLLRSALLTHRIALALLQPAWLTSNHWRRHVLIRILELFFTHHFCPESWHFVAGSITAIFLLFLNTHTILRFAHHCRIGVSSTSHLIVKVVHRCFKFLHLLLVWFYNGLHLALRWSNRATVLLRGVPKTVGHTALLRL